VTVDWALIEAVRADQLGGRDAVLAALLQPVVARDL
jgi:hypothetical protein